MSIDDIDSASLELIAQLQFEDLETLTSGDNGREGEDPLDGDIAADLYRAELDSLAGFVSDREIGQDTPRGDELGWLDEQLRELELEEQSTAEATDPDSSHHSAVTAPAAYQNDEYGLAWLPLEDTGSPFMATDGEASRQQQDPTNPDTVPWAGVTHEVLAVEQASAQEEQTVTDPSSQGPHDEATLGNPDEEIARGTTPATRSTIRFFLAWGYSWVEWFEKRRQKECTACTTAMKPALLSHCACDHRYCGGCITQLTLASLVDESLFPPRCCGEPIPIEIIEAHLTPGQMAEFRQKAIEYSTPNRMYCYVPTRSAFIPPENIFERDGVCPRCLDWTCVFCKGKWHEGLGACPEDVATGDVLRLAEEQGWKRCYNCHRMIELSTGCNHITCTCGAEFCYDCGLQWKTCMCPQWEDDRLLERVVHRGRPRRRRRRRRRGGAGREERAESVERARGNIVQNQGCQHARWDRVTDQGGRRCEVCRDILPLFILRCRGCQFEACARCRRHRL